MSTEKPMQPQQRIIWICLAVILLTMVVWFDAVMLPGDYLFFWRWTESQIIFESLITVGFLVAAIFGYFILRKGAGDWSQWKTLRLGIFIWIGMIGLLTLFSLFVYTFGNQEISDKYEGDGYTVTALGSVIESEGVGDFFIVMSCDYRGIYKRVIHIDRVTGVEDVAFVFENDMLRASYRIEGREQRYTELDVNALYEQCLSGESPRPE
ncbi:hypothetical protein [Aliidiomarina sanyensis]|uniref:Uncharacterized protein n=1 Tax=Aliidiomarina sanyensis TaxID=1249555 RepID=A0A432WPI1_9GAMM|nr:hypothetical protein [Aliidiomarina sanyensis]RUO35693.1 hypothetical protein CWE11_02740 [Aliidiomarina sanyensis]